MIYSVKTINQKEKPGFFVYFVAKKKIFKKANVRNKAKRIARHAFFEVKKGILKDCDDCFDLGLNKQVIFFLENAILKEDFKSIVQSFEKDIINIIKNNNKNK